MSEKEERVTLALFTTLFLVLNFARAQPINGTLFRTENSTSSIVIHATPLKTDLNLEDDTLHLNANSTKPEVERLLQVLNDTMERIDKILNTTVDRDQRTIRNETGDGSHQDFENVRNILHKVQTFLKEKGETISKDTETSLDREVRAIQRFLQDSEEQIIVVRGDAGGNGTHVEFERNGKSLGIIDSVKQVSSKVNEGLRSAVENAENFVSDGVGQIQDQVQGFLQGITSFFSDKKDEPLPSNPQLQKIAVGNSPGFAPQNIFRQQEVIRQ